MYYLIAFYQRIVELWCHAKNFPNDPWIVSMQNLVNPKEQFIFLHTGIFIGLIWGQILAPPQLKNEQKLPKMLYIIPNFLVLQFGENLMKIRKKIAKSQMHQNLHTNVNENMFSFRFLCKFSWVFMKGN